MYVVEKKHDATAEATFEVAETLEEAAAYGLAFAHRYNFQVTDEGVLVDGDGDSALFENIWMHETEDGSMGVLGFIHCYGDGPCLRVVKVD